MGFFFAGEFCFFFDTFPFILSMSNSDNHKANRSRHGGALLAAAASKDAMRRLLERRDLEVVLHPYTYIGAIRQLLHELESNLRRSFVHEIKYALDMAELLLEVHCSGKEMKMLYEAFYSTFDHSSISQFLLLKRFLHFICTIRLTELATPVDDPAESPRKRPRPDDAPNSVVKRPRLFDLASPSISAPSLLEWESSDDEWESWSDEEESWSDEEESWSDEEESSSDEEESSSDEE